jgi:DNA-binding CsgD family transcriptional regulator
MTGERQLRDAADFARALDHVHDAPTLDFLIRDALPRIVPAEEPDDDESALLTLLRPAMTAAAERVAADEVRARAGLTAREAEVLGYVADGDSNALIAKRLGVRPRTVDKHLEHAYAKLGVTSRTAAIACLRGIAH